MTTSTQIQLARRPHGWPTPEDFRTVQVELPALGDGEIRVENEFLSIDPYMRGRMIDRPSYAPPYVLDATMTGGAVGHVVESNAPAVPVGALVSSDWGWRNIAQGPAAQVSVLPELDGLPSSLYLGVLGMTSFTAWVGLTQVARLQPGDAVFVSGAAGAVGSVVGQIAKQLGAGRVIGSAGSAAKVERIVHHYGFDAAFNYKDGPVGRQLRAAAPDGIEVYFDNVGGDHLEAAIAAMNRNGRAALCGAITGYNATEAQPGPRNMTDLITKSLTLTGFTVPSYWHLYGEFLGRMREWFDAGLIAYDEWVVEGLEHAVDGFLDMMRGANTGKAIVRV